MEKEYDNTPRKITFFYGGYYETSKFDKMLDFFLSIILPTSLLLGIVTVAVLYALGMLPSS